jgi:phage baseplate assembly protein W
MSSIGVRLPLRRSSTTGFVMNRSLLSTVKQNLKMLLLTTPGERVMVPDYGVGLRNFLFSNFTPDLIARVENKIKEQVKIYMPAVNIKNIAVNTKDADLNTLSLVIIYSIPGLTSNDLLSVTI